MLSGAQLCAQFSASSRSMLGMVTGVPCITAKVMGSPALLGARESRRKDFSSCLAPAL